MKTNSGKKEDKPLQKDFLTTNIKNNNNFKFKLKKVIIPTITILMVFGVAIFLIFILKITK